MRRTALSATVLVLAVSALASIAPAAGPLARVRVGTTGNGSERVGTIPIVRHPPVGQTVVMSMPPRQIPSLHAGDVLRVWPSSRSRPIAGDRRRDATGTPTTTARSSARG